jgi:2-aminoethylphosphonate-pyruvate transaminase
MQSICTFLGDSVQVNVLEFEEDEAVCVEQVELHLQKKQAEYSVVCVVHCETSSGVINPVVAVGQLVKRFQPRAAYFVDAMSSFGAVPLDLEEAKVDFLVSSANKCLQGVPGFGFIIARTEKLIQCQGKK